MGLRTFINGFQGGLTTWFIGSRKTIRVLFTDDDGVPEDTDGASGLSLLVYSDSNRTTLVDTLALVADTGKKGHATYEFTAAYSGLVQNNTYYVWGQITRTAGDVDISLVAATLAVQ